MTNQAMELRLTQRFARIAAERETQLKAFITVGLGKLAEAVKHDIKQLIGRQQQLDDAQRHLKEHLDMMATHYVEHVQQLEKRVQQLEQRLTMVAGSGNNFPEQPQRN